MSSAAFYTWMQARLAGRCWRLWVAGACLLAAAFGQLPPLRHTYRQVVHEQELEYNFRTLRQQIADPWRSYSDVATSHTAKMVFRLTLPLLARILHLSLGELLALQVALGLLMYWLLAAVLARALADRVAGALLALGVSGTYFGYACVSELSGYFDAYCYTLLVAAMLARHRWLVVALVLAGSFIDERMLLAAPLVVLWYGVEAYGWQGQPAWRYLLTARAAALYAAGAAYAGLRLWLAARYHLPTYTGLVGLSALRGSLQDGYLPIGYISALKTYLLLPLLAGVVLWRLRRYGLLTLAVTCATPIFIGSMLVTDITRSLAYGGPALVLGASLLGQHTTLAQRRSLAVLIALGALVLPSYQTLGKVLYQPSALLAALRWALG